MNKLSPKQEADFLDVIACAIAERERISGYMSLDALASVCKYYNYPAEQIALDLYFFLRNGEEDRAMVHQFREYVRSHGENTEKLSKAIAAIRSAGYRDVTSEANAQNGSECWYVFANNDGVHYCDDLNDILELAEAIE